MTRMMVRKKKMEWGRERASILRVRRAGGKLENEEQDKEKEEDDPSR